MTSWPATKPPLRAAHAGRGDLRVEMSETVSQGLIRVLFTSLVVLLVQDLSGTHIEGDGRDADVAIGNPGQKARVTQPLEVTYVRFVGRVLRCGLGRQKRVENTSPHVEDRDLGVLSRSVGQHL